MFFLLFTRHYNKLGEKANSLLFWLSGNNGKEIILVFVLTFRFRGNNLTILGYSLFSFQAPYQFLFQSFASFFQPRYNVYRFDASSFFCRSQYLITVCSNFVILLLWGGAEIKDN